MLNVLSTMPTSSTSADTSAPQTKVILLTSMGLTKVGRTKLPLLLKPLYALVIRAPHEDKLGMERVIYHAAGWTWPADEAEPSAHILLPGWEKRLPGAPGYLKSVLIVQPALYTDGVGKADTAGGKKVYRAEDRDFSAYTISRRDVAHFIVEDALANWNKWEGKCVRLAY